MLRMRPVDERAGNLSAADFQAYSDNFDTSGMDFVAQRLPPGQVTRTPSIRRPCHQHRLLAYQAPCALIAQPVIASNCWAVTSRPSMIMLAAYSALIRGLRFALVQTLVGSWRNRPGSLPWLLFGMWLLV